METSRQRLEEATSSSSPSNAKAAKLMLSQPPISLLARGRVVSLDRRDYPGVGMDESSHYDASEDAGDSTTTDEDEEQRQRQRRNAIERQQPPQPQHHHHPQQQQQKQLQLQQPIYPSSYPRLDVTDDIHHEDDSDDYSSDGESSYFSEHLPSPKSAGRRSSFSALSSLRATNHLLRPMIPGSHAGAASRLSPRTIPTGPMTTSNKTTTTPHSSMPFRRQAPNHGRESDASLSFSDEDEEPPLVIQHHGAMLSSTENVPPPPVLSPLSASDTNASPKNLSSTSRRTVAGVSTSISTSSQNDVWVDKKGTIVPLRPPDLGDDQLRLFPVRPNRLHSSSSLVSSSSDETNGNHNNDEMMRSNHSITTREGGEPETLDPAMGRLFFDRGIIRTGLSSSDEEGENNYPTPATKSRSSNHSGGGYSSSDDADHATSSDPSTVQSELRKIVVHESDRLELSSTILENGRQSPVPDKMYLLRVPSLASTTEIDKRNNNGTPSSNHQGGGDDGGSKEVEKKTTGFLRRLFTSSPTKSMPPSPAKQLANGEIYSYQQDGQVLAHPRAQRISTTQPSPQPRTRDQMEAAWLASNNNLSHGNEFMPATAWGTASDGGGGTYRPSFERASTRSSSNNGTISMVYSDDEDDLDDGSRGSSSRYGRKHGTRRSGGGRRGNGSGNTGSFGSGGSGVRNRGTNSSEANGNQQHQQQERGNMQHYLSGSSNQSSPARVGPSDPGAARDILSSNESQPSKSGPFQVYWRRWIMLMYMSFLNLLSDWTCYSVAPISVMTSEAYGTIDPELLVVIFLGANAVATACEPIILSRLGLRRTIVFGSLLLMIGSIIKSGGIPLIMRSEIEKGHGEWRIYGGFFLVGLSQPLYQCTPALLSASWFPEKERTLATGVALNSNQLGIGCAFVFGTLLVGSSDDIPNYFGLLSILSTIGFIGCALQFDDAPPTPPSNSARIIRGTMEINMPSFGDMIWRTAPSVSSPVPQQVKRTLTPSGKEEGPPSLYQGRELATSSGVRSRSPSPVLTSSSQRSRSSRKSGSTRRGERTSSERRKGSDGSRSRSSRSQASSRSSKQRSGNGRRGNGSSRVRSASSENGFRAGPSVPSPASTDGPTELAALEIDASKQGMHEFYHGVAPSPMMPGRVGPPNQRSNSGLYSGESSEGEPGYDRGIDQGFAGGAYRNPNYPQMQQQPLYGSDVIGTPSRQNHGSLRVDENYTPPDTPFANLNYASSGSFHSAMNATPNNQAAFPQYAPYGEYYPDGSYMPQQDPGAYYYPPPPIPIHALPLQGTMDEGAEPVVTLTENHLEIHIRDDQIWLSARACFSRPGFIHALVAFSVSGIVINTLSTYMDYLVRLGGASQAYVGIVGGSFQLVIMLSSLIVGRQTDKTRAYYSVIIGLLVLGAFALAECGVSLDADRGGDVRWTLLIVAVLVGPLQPVATELGVDVAYPLSENTVLVIQQLFSNMLSALFIPFFRAVKDVGTNADIGDMYERPQYTFSFYLMIVIHATATVFFASFNGRYLRYEHELKRKAEEKATEDARFIPQHAFQPYYHDFNHHVTGNVPYQQTEGAPLLEQHVV